MKQIHGLLSLILIFISVIIGMITILMTSILNGVIYTGILFLAFGTVIYFYCRKCSCRLDSCGHLIPGKLTKIFPDRPPGEYSTFDFLITSVALALITIYPQYWLWKHKSFFIIFWVLIVIGLADIFLFVCKECKNEHCPMCPDFKK